MPEPEIRIFFSFNCIFVLIQHIPEEKDRTVACSLCSHLGSTEFETLTCKNSHEAIRHSFVLTKHVANFPPADADISCWNVCVGTNMPYKFRHKGLAKTHDLIIRFSFGIEIGATFTAAHRKTCETVFKSLLKSQKLEDGLIN